MYIYIYVTQSIFAALFTLFCFHEQLHCQNLDSSEAWLLCHGLVSKARMCIQQGWDRRFSKADMMWAEQM